MLEPEALDAAIALVEFLKTSLVRFLRQELVTSKFERLQQKVLGLVRKAGGRLKKRELQRRASLSAGDFQIIMRGRLEDERFVYDLQPTASGQTEVWVQLQEEADA